MASDEIPISITSEHIIKLKNHINNTFNAFNADGEVDLDKCQRNVAYSSGNIYTNYNGLQFQEQIKLNQIAEDLAKIKAIAYDDIKRTKLAYDIDSKGTNVILEGHEGVRAKQREYDDQNAYVEFLKRTVSQLQYYANSVNVILKREEVRAKYGL